MTYGTINDAQTIAGNGGLDSMGWYYMCWCNEINEGLLAKM